MQSNKLWHDAPNIVRVLGLENAQNDEYIVYTSWCSGGTLADINRQFGYHSVKRVLAGACGRAVPDQRVWGCATGAQLAERKQGVARGNQGDGLLGTDFPT